MYTIINNVLYFNAGFAEPWGFEQPLLGPRENCTNIKKNILSVHVSIQSFLMHSIKLELLQTNEGYECNVASRVMIFQKRNNSKQVVEFHVFLNLLLLFWSSVKNFASRKGSASKKSLRNPALMGLNQKLFINIAYFLRTFSWIEIFMELMDFNEIDVKRYRKICINISSIIFENLDKLCTE